MFLPLALMNSLKDLSSPALSGFITSVTRKPWRSSAALTASASPFTPGSFGHPAV